MSLFLSFYVHRRKRASRIKVWWRRRNSWRTNKEISVVKFNAQTWMRNGRNGPVWCEWTSDLETEQKSGKHSCSSSQKFRKQSSVAAVCPEAAITQKSLALYARRCDLLVYCKKMVNLSTPSLYFYEEGFVVQRRRKWPPDLKSWKTMQSWERVQWSPRYWNLLFPTDLFPYVCRKGQVVLHGTIENIFGVLLNGVDIRMS